MSIRGRAAERAISLADRFWSKVDRSGDGCWEWQAHLQRHGYGVFGIGGKTQLAHRVAYRLAVGEIPADLVIDHLCINPQCVRPDHLEVVTRYENSRRGIAWTAEHCPSTKYRNQTTCKRGHQYDYSYTHTYANGRVATFRRCLTCNRANGNARYRALKGRAR